MKNLNRQNYKKSIYPFKSPHWKNKKWTSILNHLNSIAGDPRRLPTRTPSDKTKWEYRETSKYKKVSDEIVDMMRDFENLKEYTSLENLQNTLPLRYVFVLPIRHAIVIYSAYSMLISKKKGELASYAEVQKFLGVPINRKNKDSNYYVYNLLTLYFRLFKISKPFRYLLELPVISYCKSLNDSLNRRSLDLIKKNIGKMEEWNKVSSPGNILLIVHEILLKDGFYFALKFVRYLFRASRKIKAILVSKRDNWEKIRELTERYLQFERSIFYIRHKYINFYKSLNSKIREIYLSGAKNKKQLIEELNKNIQVEELFKKVYKIFKVHYTETEAEAKKEIFTSFLKFFKGKLAEQTFSLINSVLIKLIDEMIGKAQHLRQSSKYNEAIVELKDALKIADKLYESEQQNKKKKLIRKKMCDFEIDKAQELRQSSKYNEAIVELKDALKIADEMNDSKKKAKIKKKFQQKIRKIRESKIRQTIVDLGTKFPRLQVVEIAEECNENKEIIISTVKNMIKNNEIYAKYFTSSQAVAFDQQANIEEMDKLMKAYKDWERKDKGKQK